MQETARALVVGVRQGRCTPSHLLLPGVWHLTVAPANYVQKKISHVCRAYGSRFPPRPTTAELGLRLQLQLHLLMVRTWARVSTSWVHLLKNAAKDATPKAVVRMH